MSKVRYYQINVEAELQHAVHVGQVVEHDLGVDAGEEAAQHARRQEHERRVQPDDTGNCTIQGESDVV